MPGQRAMRGAAEAAVLARLMMARFDSLRVVRYFAVAACAVVY